MKTKYLITLISSVLLFTACTSSGDGMESSSQITMESLESSITKLPDESTEAVDSNESFGLLYVREEEKLAHDVYVVLFEKWGSRIFQNIAYSEQAHTDAIKTLLDNYGLPDPAADLPPGQFNDLSLQNLYDEITNQGSLSSTDALKIGASIEEIDIQDLRMRLEGELPEDIRKVYENLLAGSYNHIFAFVTTLERQTGEIYTPQYLSSDEYQDALAQGRDSGHGDGGGGFYGGTSTP